MRILLVDDDPVALEIGRAMVRALGHEVIAAADGLSAIRAVEEESPDFVLLDFVMPGIDGVEVANRIRAMRPNTWLPIVFMSGLDGEANVVRLMRAGGEDFLRKPLNRDILAGRLRGYARVVGIQRELEAKNRELERYKQHMEEEKRVARHLMDRLAQRANLSGSPLSVYAKPLADFNGDLVAVARTPGDVLHVLLADGLGHGLTGSLAVLPITPAFYAMTEKGFGIAAIARELNAKIRQSLPIECFAAAALVAIDIRDKTVEVWNGGIPPQVVLDENGRVRGEFPSRHLPLGIAEPERFDASTETVLYSERCRVMLYSDGLVEAESPAGEQYGHERLVRVLAAAPVGRETEHIAADFESHLAGNPATDDVTLVVLRCDDLHESEISPPQQVEAGESSSWSFSLEVGAATVRTLDLVPFVGSVVSGLRGAARDNERIFIVLTELLSNAIDHGLLGLDSRLRQGPEGLDEYLRVRGEKLANLDRGSVVIEIEQPQGRAELVIGVRDSGPGFDYVRQLGAGLPEENLFYGRGIPLVQALCSRLEYRGSGSHAVATIAVDAGTK